jgi:hypothetical protein
MLRKILVLAVWTLAMLLQTSPAPLHTWELGADGLASTSLPAGAVPISPSYQADLNRDGLLERLVLANGHLTIYSRDAPAWQSPSGWTVVQAQITDLNNDGVSEAALLVWRPFRPWPVDQWLPHGGRIATFQDEQGNSCQIILIGWRISHYGELWAGSALAAPVRSFAVADLNGDKHQEVVTLEGSYADPRSAPGHVFKVWEWNGFGFSVVSGMEGTFDKMALVLTKTGRILILVP